MLSLKCENLTVQTDMRTGAMRLSADIAPSFREKLKIAYEKLNGKLLRVDVKLWKDKRSVDANAYCWLLCDAIAKIIKSTKEDVYKTFIRDVGKFEIVPLREDAILDFDRLWKGDRLGWFVDILDDSKLDGYKKVAVYFGSSSYNTAEMAHLINHAIQEAEALGIPTLTEEEAEKMKAGWKNDKKDKGLLDTG